MKAGRPFSFLWLVSFLLVRKPASSSQEGALDPVSGELRVWPGEGAGQTWAVGAETLKQVPSWGQGVGPRSALSAGRSPQLGPGFPVTAPLYQRLGTSLGRGHRTALLSRPPSAAPDGRARRVSTSSH